MGGTRYGARKYRTATRLVITAVPVVLLLLIDGLPAGGAHGAGGAKKAHRVKAAVDSSTSPTCGGKTTLVADGTTWQCTFDSEFNGTSLNTDQWVPVVTATSGYTSGTTACFVDQPDTVSVGNGYLSLTARKVATPFTCNDPLGSFTTSYISGYVTTSGLFAQTYGRIEIMAKVPSSSVTGLQSSLWLYPQVGRAGELDIAEAFSDRPGMAIPYFHYDVDLLNQNAATDTNIVTTDGCAIDPNTFNDYVLEWSPTTITAIYDGRTCLVDHYDELLGAPGAPFNQPFFINLTQALGIGINQFDPTTTPLPATTEVKFVRVWQSVP